MMQITEDTPPDMLAGAMDLTVHLPSGKAVKMSVERSTPMMDLLVQITTANHLQLSLHTLQVLGMAPSSEHSDKVLPFKPNTPIGALDTQHIRVLPKGRSLPVPKYAAPGHQPFESTFRLKVHLPRNQLYVTRVSRNVILKDIMKKVCEEKNLDPLKYDFKHPGNLDEVLDPKLTLSDYQITEIYVVAKGTTNLNQAFSAADIMVLRKEEERKQMHNKTGGGVFNLIFKRGKSSMGSGSVSSDNRSISPTHSDDSRSVTPPAVVPTIVSPPKKDPPPDRPKPPMRKRRPAPKPPQIQVAEASGDNEEKSSSVSNEIATASKKPNENGLTICHSRNSSDSSGYHEASILSDHCANTSLPRSRPKSAFVGDLAPPAGLSNLTKMSAHSRSTTSLIAGRKKKAAPPPPQPVAISPANSLVAHSEKPSPLVASQPDITTTTHHQESVTSSHLTPAPTPLDSLPPCSVEDSGTPGRIHQEEKSLDSTDSGIAHDTQSHEETEEDFGFHTPPPPPILDEIIVGKVESKIEADPVPVAIETEKPVEIKEEISIVDNPLAASSPIAIPSPPHVPPPNVGELKKVEKALIENSIKQTQPESELVDIDWQYQLPSPPKAFRDSSPIHVVPTDTISVVSDSVVTSPELFEKLRTLEDNQSEKDTLKSEVTSIASEEPLNTLSLENLEKRQSLVYNRELATSLKMTDSIETSGKSTSNYASPLTTGFQVNSNSANLKSPQEPPKPARAKMTTSHHHTLPNFQITTYEVPKHKNIKVFEDDTIRSNTHGTLAPTLSKNEFGRSMENINFAKRSSIDEFSSNNNEREYKFYKSRQTQNMSRSGSFSTDRSPLKPVSRSMSTMTLNNLNRYQVGRRDESDMSRSNSLFDVSGGLQSLEVMKLIQNKLNTPTGSMENISVKEKPAVPQKPILDVKPEESPNCPDPTPILETPQETPPKGASPEPVKKYYYRGPPAVNMSTWSERPKIPVAVKEDADYKLGNHTTSNISSKLIVNTTNNNITSNNSIEVKSNGHTEISKPQVSVNVNGTNTEQITQKSGNVVIKIGSTQNGNGFVKNNDHQRFMAPTAYRKPFSNINRIDGNIIRTSQRPHSIALPSDFDISRVPVVRSVEFKKSYKELHASNTSITHLNQGNEDFKSLSQYYDKSDSFADKFRSTENLRNIEKQESEPPKRVFRVSSFKPADNHAPTVRGFKVSSNNTKNDIINNRLSWSPSSTCNTLPTKPKVEKEYIPNKHVPFSQLTLRRTESSKLYAADQNSNKIISEPTKHIITENYNSLPPSLNNKSNQQSVAPPPPPPQMPKVALKKVVPQNRSPTNNSGDPRDMLLESIRNFGGKKGLRAAKA